MRYPHRARNARVGFTLIELMTAVALVGLLMLVFIPRLRVSPRQHARHAAEQLVRDLELARTRALSTRSMVQVVFNQAAGTYTAYLDDNQDGVIGQTAAENAALGVFGVRTLPQGVQFGRGSAGGVPGEAGTGAITLGGPFVIFDNRGLPQPFGLRGTVYFASADEPMAVAAASVTGSGSFRTWIYMPGGWE